MKIRNDFVTNSSSSSFIISLKEDLPVNFMKYKERLMKLNNMNDFFEKIGEPWFNEEFFEKVKEDGNFTEEQMNILKAIDLEVYDEYKTVKKALEDENSSVYFLCEDWDIMYDELDFINYIKEKVIVTLE